MSAIVTEKRCSKCGDVKPLSEFSNDKSRRSGLRHSCKSCERERHRKYYIENTDKFRERDLKNYAEKAEVRIKYRTKNIDKVHKYYRKWRAENTEKVSEYRRNRRARKKANGGKITNAEWHVILERYDNKCLCCGRSDVNLTMDHVVPIKLGGLHVAKNVQPLCHSCNCRKGIKVIDYRSLSTRKDKT